MKTCFLAGASGSIGQSTLSVLTRLKQASIKEQSYQLVGFSVKTRVKEMIALLKKLDSQSEQDSPLLINLKTVAIENPSSRKIFKDFLQTTSRWREVKLLDHTEAALLESEADVLINAQSGSAGLAPTICGLKQGMKILLANKESLVMGAPLIRQILQEQGNTLAERILPIDSEHKALQTLSRGWKSHEITKLILTASGGPFWNNWIDNPTPQQALKHPNWEMGQKISIDSATMMNKGLEIIEAHVLFDVPYSKIEAIIHPEQVIHAFTQLVNGEFLALFGANDMCYSIQGALTYPNLIESDYKPFRLGEHAALTFHQVPLERYPLFKLACECGARGGMLPVVLNAANEACVMAFIRGQLTFKDIFKTVLSQIERYEQQTSTTGQAKIAYSLETILELDQSIQRQVAENL